jgi:hypothetical protein
MGPRDSLGLESLAQSASNRSATVSVESNSVSFFSMALKPSAILICLAPRLCVGASRLAYRVGQIVRYGYGIVVWVAIE